MFEYFGMALSTVDLPGGCLVEIKDMLLSVSHSAGNIGISRITEILECKRQT